MKKYNEMTYKEQEEIRDLIANWLKMYTHEAHVKVLSRIDEIINNEFTLKLLRELKERTEKEEKDYLRSIDYLLSDFDTFLEYDPHNHCTTHSNSYRDVLYDMYIA